MDGYKDSLAQSKDNDPAVAAREKERASGQAREDVKETVVNRTTVATPPGGFADRVSDSIADFLPLFQGALQGISPSDDRKSLVLRFNPLKYRHFEAGFVGTIGEPELFDELEDAIVSAARDAERDRIEDRLDDFDNITASVTLNVLRGPGDQPGQRGAHYWGRDPNQYAGVVDEILGGVLNAAEAPLDARRQEANRMLIEIQRQFKDARDQRQAANDQAFEAAGCVANLGFSQQTFSCVRELLGSQRSSDAVTAIKQQVQVYHVATQAIVDSRVVQILPALIDNQPQLVVSLSRTIKDELAGPETFVATLSFEKGFLNLNSVLRESGPLEVGGTRTSAYEAFLGVREREPEILKENRLIFSLSYEMNYSYGVSYDYVESVTDAGTGAVTDIPRTAEVELDDSHSLVGKLQYGRLLGKPPEDPTAPRPRADVSIEYLEVSDDDLRQDRLVAKVTYTHPVSDSVSLPFSITYANKAEFLGDEDKIVSAHVGLSYKLHKD